MLSWMTNSIALLATLAGLLILFQKKIRCASTWHATVTPLASIIGSGFLISTPLLLLTVGHWALLVMLIIVLFAYLLGGSLRFNIQYFEPLLTQPSTARGIKYLELLAKPVLGIAYIISVVFYLKLLSAFALRGIGVTTPIYENSLTTAILLFIGITGKVQGLSALEALETYSVNGKLAIIFATLLTFFAYNSELIYFDLWVLDIPSHETPWSAFRKVLGMLIIIQGFETSRYLGHAYSASMRIRTMRYAQWISGAIYLLFLSLAMIVFNGTHQISEITVINLCRTVSPVLAVLLIFAAIMSQFSAAVADTVGSSGLLVEATHGKLSEKNGYLVIAFFALLLTWFSSIYEVVVIASKAFAIYYAMQVIVTLLILRKNQDIKLRVIHMLIYFILLMILLMVIFLGIAVE